ncbi:methylmalonyl Co-A mutase-associated GTPase MeaB [Bacillus solimangrovi]|uniref:ATPase/protein kinase n=1 Tax=Bacillus solimangrovi TaxID=1305675 RepID=A0A1E5LKB0_9BACI|nr:methylmalonyl Co-A mutase-associated GTPase MeaB [Bacillus solimangrovi]OEH94514.1 ATPase/protein kinase [Bacillus solimangrovi]
MTRENDKRPEWIPKDATEGFATRIMSGVEQEEVKQAPSSKRKQRKLADYVSGVRNNDRTILAKGITLIESNAPKHIHSAQRLLNELLPHTGHSLRIGITGVPGAGKSTFIEALGSYLCEQGLQVAVLAVDPSSSVTGGSILGDKTRMESLSRNPRAFIRPSPSAGTLGGVTRKTRETMLLCEAAGYDVILIETIGVGQSEIAVRSMVDMFVLLVLTGAGDDLQGMKKGVMELADLLIVNKADGDNKRMAEVARNEYEQILHYLRPATDAWQTKALICSALHHNHIDTVWEQMKQFEHITKQSGVFEKRRQLQTKEWVYTMIKERLEADFFNHPFVKEKMPSIEQAVIEGKQPVTQAVRELFDEYEK